MLLCSDLMSSLLTVRYYDVSNNSEAFLLNWGTQYYIAVGFTVFEYFVEQWLFGPFKGVFLFTLFGFLVAIGGQTIRTLAMITGRAKENFTNLYTAASNFNHIIEEEKRADHRLVTFGIYQYDVLF